MKKRERGRKINNKYKAVQGKINEKIIKTRIGEINTKKKGKMLQHLQLEISKRKR